jgi:hypothetical protein
VSTTLACGKPNPSYSVHHYDQQSGALWLAHRYPTASSPVVTRVDIDLVLESIKRIDLQIGAWINVMGLTCDITASTNANADEKVAGSARQTAVQAIMIWNAGSFKIEEYEESLQARKDCGTAGFG